MHSETSWFNIGVVTVKNWHPPLLPFHKEAWQGWQGKQLVTPWMTMETNLAPQTSPFNQAK